MIAVPALCVAKLARPICITGVGGPSLTFMKFAAATACTISAWVVLLAPCASFADETIYKIVDEHGRVTYSSTPPAETQKSQTLDLLPPPTEEQAKEAQERVKALDEATEKAEKARREREQAEAAARDQQTTSVYITPGPIIGDGVLPYSYPTYGDGYWHNPPYRHPGQVPDRPSRPGTGTRPRPTPRR